MMDDPMSEFNITFNVNAVCRQGVTGFKGIVQHFGKYSIRPFLQKSVNQFILSPGHKFNISLSWNRSV